MPEHDDPPEAASKPPASRQASQYPRGEPAATDSDPAGSGSIDVALSGHQHKKVSDEVPPGGSGSIEVDFNPHPTLNAVPTAVPAGATDESAPISSGRASAAAIAEKTGPNKTKRARAVTAVGDAVGDAVGKVGDGVSKLGEGVSKLGDATHNVPLVGSSMAKLGEGISTVGESIHQLPTMSKTRRGRLLIRSMVVGFVLVAAWIVIIVTLQLRSTDTEDFRPGAAKILDALSNNEFEQVYEQASPRFQEMVRKERFIDDMKDLRATVGAFREIAAVNDTLVTTGPTGRVGRVSLTIAYEKANCKANVSFHYDGVSWKLLGLGVELPPELEISQQQREERIAACKDPMNPKTCDVHVAAVKIFEQLRDEKSGAVWDEATAVFQNQEERDRFIALQTDHRQRLGKFRRIIAVTEAKVIGGTYATFDLLLEYEKSSGVRGVLAFYRNTKSTPWKLRSIKVVVPMPRAADVASLAPKPEVVVPVPVPPVVKPVKPGPAPPSRPPIPTTGSGQPAISVPKK